MKSILIGCLALLAAERMTPSAAAEDIYELLPLSPGYPTSINSAGVVVGDRYVYEASGQGKLVLTEPPTSLSYQYITSISDDGFIAGFRYGCAGISLCYNHPLSIPAVPAVIPEELDLPIEALDEENIAGGCFLGPSFTYYSGAACGVINGQFHFFSFITDPDSGNYLPQLYQYATSINSHKVVVGQAAVSYDSHSPGTGVKHAFRYSETDGMTDLGTLTGQGESTAAAINNNDTIVGDSYDAPDRSQGYVKRHGQAMAALTVDGQIVNDALDVNDQEQIVGTTGSAAYISETPGSNTNVLLRSRLHPALAPNCQLTAATRINNAGEIIGTGYCTDGANGFLARPLGDEVKPIPLIGHHPKTWGGDTVVWRPSDGTWYVQTYPYNGSYYDSPTSQFTRQYGLKGDVPLFNADFDGDEINEFAVWRKSTGYWYICKSAYGYDCSTIGSPPVQFGLSVDIPVPADYDGDGKDELAVFRRSLPSAAIVGTWYIRNSSDDLVTAAQWGLPADYPVPADYDGDGKADQAVFRPSNGTWYIRLSSSPASPLVRQFGLKADHPMPRDLDGDGQTDLVLFRPQNGFWYACTSKNNFACFDSHGAINVQPVQFGLPGDMPILRNPIGGKFLPYAIWRKADKALNTQSVWYTRIPSTLFGVRQWGLKNDIPAGVGIRDLLKLTGIEK